MTIYKITNKINGKMYVGQTIGSIYDRWCGHRSETTRKIKYPLYLAFTKYGVENFIIDTIEVLPIDATQEDLDNREKYWISTLQTVSPRGYNLSPGGQKGRGRVSKETRLRMSLAKIGKKRKSYSEETRRKLSIANKGKKLSEEHKAKVTANFKGRTPWNKGIPQTKEVKKKLSDTKMGKKRGPTSEKVKTKLSIATKKYWDKKKLESL